MYHIPNLVFQIMIFFIFWLGGVVGVLRTTDTGLGSAPFKVCIITNVFQIIIVIWSCMMLKLICNFFVNQNFIFWLVHMLANRWQIHFFTCQGIENFKTDLSTLHPILTECRVIKSKLELDVIQYATDISSEAHVEVLFNVYHKYTSFVSKSYLIFVNSLDGTFEPSKKINFIEYNLR